MRKAVTLLCLSLILIALIPGTSWSQATFDIKIFPSKLELNGDPGSSQQFVINVQNLGAEDQVLRVYFNDYYIKPNNQFVFAKPGHYSYSCATWLSTDTLELAVPAGQTAQKAFALNVPQKAEPGGHYGIIFFEQVPPGGLSVKTVPRIGVVTLVTVPGDIVRKGTITAVQVTSSWFWPTKKLPLLPVKKVHCRVVFRNEGNVHLTIKGRVTYTPTFGWGTGVVEINEMTVLPKTTRYLETDLKNPPFMGSYEATAEVQYGPVLDVYDTTKTKKGSFQVYPLSLLLILLLLLAVIIAPIWIYRRTQYEWVYPEVEEEAELPPEGTLETEGVTEEPAPDAETPPGSPVAEAAGPPPIQTPPAQPAAPAQPAPPDEIITPAPPPKEPPTV